MPALIHSPDQYQFREIAVMQFSVPGVRLDQGIGRCLGLGQVTPRLTQGFSLVEVLVAVIILAVGLLGIAGLQVSVLKANESARFRTIATLAIYDAIDRMRADASALLGSSKKASIPQDTCTADITVGTDAITRWYRDFCAFGLPVPIAAAGSDDAMTIDCTNGESDGGCGEGNCQIIVRWDDSRGNPRSSSQSNTGFSTCTRLPLL
jgi:type IV pilus assembly protein PilV